MDRVLYLRLVGSGERQHLEIFGAVGSLAHLSHSYPGTSAIGIQRKQYISLI
jgi:hypothetical protein